MLQTGTANISFMTVELLPVAVSVECLMSTLCNFWPASKFEYP